MEIFVNSQSSAWLSASHFLQNEIKLLKAEDEMILGFHFQAWKWVLFPLSLYIIDRLIRKWRGSKEVELVKVVIFSHLFFAVCLI